MPPRQEVPVSFRKRWEATAAGVEGARRCGGGEGWSAATFQILIMYTSFFNFIFVAQTTFIIHIQTGNLGRALHGRLA